jgi:hypothetical protein
VTQLWSGGVKLAKTLFIVDDEVFQGLPDAAQKRLLDETKKLFSFVPGFTVEARNLRYFPQPFTSLIRW